jgi:hypothetical protein
MSVGKIQMLDGLVSTLSMQNYLFGLFGNDKQNSSITLTANVNKMFVTDVWGK